MAGLRLVGQRVDLGPCQGREHVGGASRIGNICKMNVEPLGGDTKALGSLPLRSPWSYPRAS